MTRFSRFAGAAILVLAFPAGVHARDAADFFVPADALDLAALLPPPAADDSPETRAELIEIHRAQSSASDARRSQAKEDSKETPFIFAAVLGPDFTADRLPIATAFLDRVQDSESEFVHPAKDRIDRPRPPLIDRTIMTCQTLKATGSYPSGHTTFGYLMAEMLARMVPEKRSAIFARAADYGYSRIVCGVHYPSDVEAGKLSAVAISAVLFANAEFRAEFAKARGEVRTVLKLP